MKSTGFRCKRNSWYRQCNDLIQAINIQKSAWGDQYYINLCFDFYDGSFIFPSEYSFPAAYMFDLIIRVSQAFDADFEALDYENDYDSERRAESILGIFAKCIEFMNMYNSTVPLKNKFIKEKKNYGLSVGPLRDILYG